MAYYGPNAHLLVSVGSDYWGEKIEDIGDYLYSMLILFTFDTISVLVTSIILWKVININMFQEFCGILAKYWNFLFIKLAYNMAGYFTSLDVNLGGDATGEFSWITPDARLSLIYNSKDLTDEAKSILLANTTLK